MNSPGQRQLSGESQERLGASVTVEQFVAELHGVACGINDEKDLLTVMGDRVCRGLNVHDGLITYMVRSTSIDASEKVLENGLTFEGRMNHPAAIDAATVRIIPALGSKAVLLAGPSNPDQAKVNTYALGYRYYANPVGSSAKLVFAFPFSTDGNIGGLIGDAAFDTTPLSRADGTYVVQQDSIDLGHYFVPGRFAFGYLNLDNQQFVRNPDFNFAS